MVFLEILANVACRGGLHAPYQSIVEYFRGVDAGVEQQMIQRDYLGDHRDVLSGVEEYRDLRQLDFQYCRRFNIETSALDDRVLIPFFQLHDDLDPFLLPDRADPKNGRNVDQTDATDLHVVALHLVAAANEHIVSALARNHEIVGNEAVATLDEIQHALGFTDSTHASEEEADAKYVGKRAM